MSGTISWIYGRCGICRYVLIANQRLSDVDQAALRRPSGSIREHTSNKPGYRIIRQLNHLAPVDTKLSPSSQ